MSTGFFAYVQRLGTYEATYGSLAGVAISMLWIFLTVFLIVIGAVVNAELERQTPRDSTVVSACTRALRDIVRGAGGLRRGDFQWSGHSSEPGAFARS